MSSEENWGIVENSDAEMSGKAEAWVAPRTMADRGRSLTAFIGEHPELCLGIALALGVAVGLAVKRR